MSGFIKAKAELKEYCKQESVEQGKQEKIQRSAAIAANIAIDNREKAQRTMAQLDTILGN